MRASYESNKTQSKAWVAEARRLRSAGRSANDAFTLIEVVISAALMALILTGAYLCLSACLSSQREMTPRLEAIQNARVAMALMTADLRASCPLDPDEQFLGMPRMLGDAPADNLDFATHNYTPRRTGEGDFCEESFFVARDAETRQLCLWRRRNPTLALDPLSGGTREQIATGVLGLRFEYFDGFDWYDSWGDTTRNGKKQTSNRSQPNLEGMPEAVRITLWLNAGPQGMVQAGTTSNEKPESAKTQVPMMFQTVARLNLGGASQSSSSSSTGSDQSSAGASGGNL
jgi:prepilin-type N-terminal cleavage/methylation domain-containing protein